MQQQQLELVLSFFLSFFTIDTSFLFFLLRQEAAKQRAEEQRKREEVRQEARVREEARLREEARQKEVYYSLFGFCYDA